MSSPHNQPVVEDIVSAFKTTQNQSWSVFNDKLGNIPIKDCKKKDNFKSENPIELSVDDISVFGIVPRLEQLTLISCSKCLMIVKRDCIDIHYNRRHSNPDNDNFSLESFIMPNAKTNKHKRQKVNVRKPSEKKIITNKNINPIKQEIKTEFDLEIKTEFDQEIVTQFDQKIKMEFDQKILTEFVQEIKTEFIQEIKTEFDQEIKTEFDQEIKTEFDQEIETEFDQEIKTEYDQEIKTEYDQEIKTEFDQEIKTEFDQEIKTEFDQEEFERLQEIIQTKVKQENKIQYVDDECNVNLAITSCSPSTSSGACDWNFKPCTQSSDYYADHKVNDRIIETGKKEFHKILSALPCSYAEEKEYLSVAKKESSVNCVINSSELNKNIKDSNEQTKSSLTLDIAGFLGDDKSVINDEFHDVCKRNYQLPSVLQNNEEQTRFTTINTYSSNSMSNEHFVNRTSCKRSSMTSISFNKGLKRKSNIKYSDVINNKCLNNVTFDRLPTARLSIKEEYKITPNKKYSNVIFDESEEKDKIKDNSQIVYYQLSSELLSNKEQLVFTTNKSNCLNITSDKAYCSVLANNYQSTELPKLRRKIKIENNYESKDYPKIEFSKLNLKLLNNRTQFQFSLNNKYSGVTGNKYFDHTVTDYNYLSTLPFSIKEEINHSQNNETVINNESFDNTITSFDQPSMVLLDVKKESKLSQIDEYLNATIDYDCYDPKYEYCQKMTKYSNKALMQHSPSFDYVLNEDEENNEIIDDCESNNYSFPPELQNNEEETECTSSSSDVVSSVCSDNSLNSYDESSTKSLDSEEESKPTLTNCLGVMDNFENDYYQSSSELSDNEAQTTFSQSPKYQSDICYANSDSSVISYDESTNIKDANSSKDTCLDFMSDENDSVTSNDHQSNIDLQDIIKETKSTQTNVCFNRINRKQFIDHITRIDESIVDSLGVLDNMSKCTQTDLSLECCLNCHEITEDFLDNYIPIDSNVEVTDFIITPNGSNAQIATDNVVNNFIPVISSAQKAKCSANNFTPVSSSAQIIDNTIIPISVEEYELMDSDISDHYVSNISNYLSYIKQFPWGAESQNKHLSNRSTHSPIIENNRLLKNNDKIYSSEPYADKPKQNENVFHRNIMNGSTPHMDKNQVICKDHLQKTIIENIRYVKKCNSYSNVEIKSKIKKNLKRRVGGQIADGKENHEWTIGGVKKFKRVEFVVRKGTYSDESSDNNDNIDE